MCTFVQHVYTDVFVCVFVCAHVCACVRARVCVCGMCGYHHFYSLSLYLSDVSLSASM